MIDNIIYSVYCNIITIKFYWHENHMQQKGNKVKYFWNLYKEAVVGLVTSELPWNAFPRRFYMR